jgi:hypothetical protein
MLLPSSVDGHTAGGNWVVKLELTEDQVQQLIRSMEWAKMMDHHDDKTLDQPPDMEVLAHREFLQEILDKLYQAVLE